MQSLTVQNNIYVSKKINAITQWATQATDNNNYNTINTMKYSF